MFIMNKLRKFSKYIVYVLLIVGAVSMIFPFFWMISTSLKTPVEAVQFPPS